MNIWTLPTKAHRDLWWLLTSPNIIEDGTRISFSTKEKEMLLPNAWEWLLRDAECPSNLQGWVQNPHRQRKLGLYAEDLLHYYLQWGSPWRVRWHDVQIQENRRSIGAVDFILEQNGVVEHWEMTVKFYLQHKPTGQWTDWVGADQRDSLHKKWNHFYTKQLPLGRHPATIERLTLDNIATPTRSRIWHCGLLFAEWQAPCILPVETEFGWTNSAQPMGHWIRRKDFIQQFFSPKYQWVIREHPNWLAPIESAETLSTVDLMEYDLRRGFLMIAEMSAYEEGWREKQRWVLVNDDWGMNLTS
jgi:uncharacterized protein